MFNTHLCIQIFEDKWNSFWQFPPWCNFVVVFSHVTKIICKIYWVDKVSSGFFAHLTDYVRDGFLMRSTVGYSSLHKKLRTFEAIFIKRGLFCEIFLCEVMEMQFAKCDELFPSTLTSADSKHGTVDKKPPKLQKKTIYFRANIEHFWTN